MDWQEINALADLIRATPIISDDRARVDYQNASDQTGNRKIRNRVFGKLGLSNNFSAVLLSELEQANDDGAQRRRRRAQRP